MLILVDTCGANDEDKVLVRANSKDKPTKAGQRSRLVCFSTSALSNIAKQNKTSVDEVLASRCFLLLLFRLKSWPC